MQILLSEVVNMEYDAIWQAFAQTGDPLYYLLYRGLRGGTEADSRETGLGDHPRPTD